MKIYVASSWRNIYQPLVVHELRKEGYSVYDFRNPNEAFGFHWSSIDPLWKEWDRDKFISALNHSLAEEGFNSDFFAMNMSDTCVLVLPCGRSAHLEAGWMKGAGKRLYIYVPENIEPELMYKMADGVFPDLEMLIKNIECRGYK